jgi:hypothetical protein
MTRARRREQGGFALLVIFLIAAAVAFTMYQELPRAAFESARDKEQVLMDRGNQYKRAIQVFYAVNKRYPAEIKDLENTNDKRFLRRRYIDPMTGQDEWRLIHTNGSYLTDSLVQKPPVQNAGNGAPGQGQVPGGGPLGANNLNTAQAASASNNGASTAANPSDPAAAAPLNAAVLRRPSDRGFPASPGLQPQGVNAPNPTVAGANSMPYDPGNPATWPAITLTPATAQPGQPQAGQPQPNVQNMVGQPAVLNPSAGAGQPGGVNQPFPGQPLNYPPQPTGILGQLGAQLAGQAGGQLAGQGNANPQPAFNNPNPPGQDGQFTPQPNQPAPLPQPATPFSPTQPVTGIQPPSLAAGGFNPQNPNAAGAQPSAAIPGGPGGVVPGNAALTAIDNTLFRPTQALASAGPTGSPGIAGVATKFEGPSIKSYRERTKYQEWEFVYEPAAIKPGQPGVPGQNPQPNPNGQNPGAPGQATGVTPQGGTASPLSQPNVPSQPSPFSPQPNPFSPQPNPFTPQPPTQ